MQEWCLAQSVSCYLSKRVVLLCLYVDATVDRARDSLRATQLIFPKKSYKWPTGILKTAEHR